MEANDAVWIGQNDRRYGPYEIEAVRRWLAQGKFSPEALGWRAGMAEWVPLATLVRKLADPPQVPPATPAARALGAGAGSNGDPKVSDCGAALSSSHGGAPAIPVWETPEAMTRADLPTPPSLHWGLVLLFTVLTLGIFSLVWMFVQANWVRKIDPESNARLLLGIGLACNVLAIFMGIGSSGTSSAVVGLEVLLRLAFLVLFMVAYFSMAGSMKRAMTGSAARLKIGGATLFFFTTWYLQGQLTWLARWKESGRTSPLPPKGIFWALWTVPVALAILAAIAIPAYQQYLLRAQVAGVLAEAHGLEDRIAAAAGSRGSWPEDNAQAGLREPTDYAHGALAGFVVEPVKDGTALRMVFSDTAALPLRGKQLTLVARPKDGAIVWACQSTDLQDAYLPEHCR
jgi:hypothetical protein